MKSIHLLRFGLGLLALLTAIILALYVPANAQEADDGYGYYEVTGVGALNIRERPYMTSRVLAVAEEGEVLIKWKRFCSLRPWCPVQKGDVQGWAGKAYLREANPYE
ncbi:MAG TPA: hypothetical protein VKA94_13395 [Hyphomicrobiales bacterium]|nr:hypothetical protein [Hyphomicrobiales bacterium]